ncbi:MAG: phosphatase PAP2 family protein [Anaerolineales bacterium]|jgi:undecaprenyl-diphosphatase
MQPLLLLDNRLTTRLRVGETPGVLRTVCIGLAHSGDSWFWGAALVATAWLDPGLWRWRALTMLLGIASTALVVMAIKIVVRRRRPAGDWGWLYRASDPHSFPSGHAARMTMLFVVCCSVGPLWLAALLLVWAPLVSLSRVAMGVHYLSDALGGTILGLLMGALVVLVI